MADEPGLRIPLRALAEEDRRGLAGHPSLDALVDYHAGDLTDAERERIQDHLALCPECTRMVLDLAAVPEAEAAESVSDEEVTAEWERFRARTANVRPLRSFRSTAVPYGLAAALLLVVLGLTIETVELGRLRRQVAALSAPRAGVQLVDLFPEGGSVERSQGEAVAVQPATWAERLVLILNLAEVQSYSRYEVAITDAAGREVWHGGELHRSPEGTFAIDVPRRSLPAGSYRIRLLGVQGAKRVPVAEYGLQIAASHG